MASKRAVQLLSKQFQSSTILKTTTATQIRQQSSTSAIAWKALNRRIAPLPTVTGQSSAITPAAAVSSILYETPVPDKAPPKRHILNCLVQNEPGVLSRVSGILAARGFNIDSLVVCSTEVADLSRMTIVLQGQDGVVEQARRQLEDLVPVWAVLDYTQAPLVQRELLLAKISILGPEYFEELLAHHREMTGSTSQYGDAARGAIASGELGNIDGQADTASATSASFEEDMDAGGVSVRSSLFGPQEDYFIYLHMAFLLLEMKLTFATPSTLTFTHATLPHPKLFA